MVNYENDFEWGQKQEQKIFPILEKTWPGLKEQERYSKYDAVSETVNIEIKSRKNLRKNSYSSTLLTMNKISDTSKTNIFVFNFVFDMKENKSEIYYIEYNKEQFRSYTKKMFSRANMKYDEKEYIYIPVEDLVFLYSDEQEKVVY